MKNILLNSALLILWAVVVINLILYYGHQPRDEQGSEEIRISVENH